MLYDLSNPFDYEKVLAKLKHYREKGKVVELKTKRLTRTLSQNSYLHILLSYLAAELGCETEWAKREYYKKAVNPDFYIYERIDPIVGTTKALRSSSDLTSEQMSISIDRLKVWAAREAGVFLPDATNEAQMLAAQIAIERAKEYI